MKILLQFLLMLYMRETGKIKLVSIFRLVIVNCNIWNMDILYLFSTPVFTKDTCNIKAEARSLYFIPMHETTIEIIFFIGLFNIMDDITFFKGRRKPRNLRNHQKMRTLKRKEILWPYFKRLARSLESME